MPAFASDSGVSILRLPAADALAAPRLRSEVTSAVERSDPVIVDLTGASSLDTTIFRILLDALVRCEERERVCVFLLPEDEAAPVSRLFRSRGLRGLLPVVSSWDEALLRAGLSQPDAPG